MSDAESRLVTKVVQDQIGEVPGTIVNLLLLHGPLMLVDIARLCPSQDFLVLRNSLLSLIQQNIVLSEYHLLSERKESAVVRYRTSAQIVLQRLRIPGFLIFVESTLGCASRVLLMEVVRRGRARMAEVVKGVEQTIRRREEMVEKRAEMARMVNMDVEDTHLPDDDGNVILDIKERKKLREKFVELVAKNYISVVQLMELPTPPVMGVPPKKKRKTFTSKKAKGTLEGIGLSETATSAAPVRSSESQLLTEMVDQYWNSDILFKLNVYALTMELLRKEIFNFCDVRFQGVLWIKFVIRSLLSRLEATGTTQISRSISKSEIDESVSKQFYDEGQPKIKNDEFSDTILRLLTHLKRHSIVKHASGGDGDFQLSMNEIKRVLQKRTILRLLTGRHGNIAGRIWSMTVNDEGREWSDQQVADEALVEVQSAREALYTLVGAGYLKMRQEGGTKRQVLYSARLDLCVRLAIAETCRMMNNVMARRNWERKATFGMLNTEVGDTKELEVHQVAEDVLESRLHRLDISLMVLRDF